MGGKDGVSLIEDWLPVSTGTIGIILLMISFLNQAFLGFQFFQVQGRSQASVMNRTVRTRMRCGVGAEGEKPSATRFAHSYSQLHSHVSQD